VTPRFTAAGSVERHWLLAHSLAVNARIDMAYAGKARSGFNPSGPDYSKMGDYALTDIRMGVGRGPWEAQLAVENLFNRAGIAQAARYALSGVDVYGPPPRTVSAGFSLSF